MKKFEDGKNAPPHQRATVQKVVETGFLSATWLALVSGVFSRFTLPKLLYDEEKSILSFKR